MPDNVTPTEPEVTSAEPVAAEPASGAEPDDSEQAELQPSGERGFWGLVAKLTALAVLISTVVGIVVALWPDPKPPPPPPPKKSAELTGRVTSGLTFREYLKLVGQDPGDLSDDLLRRRGALLRFTVTATGYKGDALTLRWKVLKGRVHPTPVESNHVSITPSADEDTVIPDPQFAPFPEAGRQFTLESDLIAPDGVTIAHDERPFRRQ